jgi:hypothetical protein
LVAGRDLQDTPGVDEDALCLETAIEVLAGLIGDTLRPWEVVIVDVLPFLTGQALEMKAHLPKEIRVRRWGWFGALPLDGAANHQKKGR